MKRGEELVDIDTYSYTKNKQDDKINEVGNMAYPKEDNISI